MVGHHYNLMLNCATHLEFTFEWVWGHPYKFAFKRSAALTVCIFIGGHSYNLRFNGGLTEH
jgi:hypothetical protein